MLWAGGVPASSWLVGVASENHKQYSAVVLPNISSTIISV